MRRPLPLFRRSLADGWRGLLGYSAGIAAVLAVYLPIYPSFGGNGQLEEMIGSLPPELVNTLGYEQIATGSGYVQATFFGLIGFVLITIAGVGWGNGAIANDEENGQLELTLAHGVTRGQLYAERTAAGSSPRRPRSPSAASPAGAVGRSAQARQSPCTRTS